MLQCNISYIANWYFGSDYMKIKKTTLCLIFMDGVQRRGKSVFTTKFPEIPGAQFIDLAKDERLSQPWSHHLVLKRDPWTGNPAPFCYGELFRLYSGKEKTTHCGLFKWLLYVSFSSWDQDQIGNKACYILKVFKIYTGKGYLC